MNISKGTKRGVTILIVLIFALTLSACTQNDSNSEPQVEGEATVDNSSIIFFYGQECPHCHEVIEFFNKNNIREKVSFSEMEVYHNTANANLMLEKASQCGLDKGSLGVPMLWAEGKCLIGTPDIVKFFEDKVK